MFTPMKSRSRWWMGFALGISFFLCFAPRGYAASAPVMRTSPHQVVAPATDIFIITMPTNSTSLPAHASLHYLGKTAQYRMKLTKAAKHSWAGSVYVSLPGTLVVKVYAKSGALIHTQDFPVKKAKQSLVPRVVIGVLFIGIALWYWRKMQKVSTPGRYGRR